MTSTKRLTAIDVYSGVGGWSLGLKMAGIRVIASYEQWEAANDTNRKNNGHKTHQVDIRKLKLNSLPKVDIVVGSPPCTQFSYSNRGGNGDIEDGLVDIRKFLSIVRYLRPKFWIMENVPRVANVLERELKPGGKLADFASLNISVSVVHTEEFGLPQRRRRCIAGNFNFDLLASYKMKAKPITLGNVINSLRRTAVIDPIYGTRLKQASLRDHLREPYLNEEETRINRAAKIGHVVYNAMTFPDPLNRPSRTVTATCTRVSRESIIVATKAKPGHFRRLTVRERASLQGFPITFQFFGQTYSQKIRMIGNALPPVLSYYLGHALKGTPAIAVPSLKIAYSNVQKPVQAPPETNPDTAGAKFPVGRTFRFAVPNLQLKSGVRFELRNHHRDAAPWELALVFGTPKSIHDLALKQVDKRTLLRNFPDELVDEIVKQLGLLRKYLMSINQSAMQAIWTRRSDGGVHPFKVLDRLNRDGGLIMRKIAKYDPAATKSVERCLKREFGSAYEDLAGVGKLTKNAPLILAGLLLSAESNSAFNKANRKS